MSVRTLELKPEVSPAAVLKVVQSPLKIPAWSVLVLIVMAGVYGYVSGRQNPIHHYVPYVGYPLVLDTTSGKACYSSAPKPPDGTASSAGALADPAAPTGPEIPLCGK